MTPKLRTLAVAIAAMLVGGMLMLSVGAMAHEPGFDYFQTRFGPAAEDICIAREHKLYRYRDVNGSTTIDEWVRREKLGPSLYGIFVYTSKANLDSTDVVFVDYWISNNDYRKNGPICG